MSRWNRLTRTAAFALLLALGAFPSALPATVTATTLQQPEQARSLPDRLSDVEFWTLVSDISEPGGFFQITDNYTSNERELGQLFSGLRDRGVRGGVYLGVGPEQNFSYIASIRPAMAFIVDIRRQAVMQHLMYKAIFELTKDRADFISLLFSMPRPDGLDDTTPIQQIWAAYDPVATDAGAIARNATRILEHLTKTHRFTLAAEETDQLAAVLAAFVRYGPDISTRGAPGRGVTGNGGTFSDLTSWSLDAAGHPQSFLSTEEHFRYVKGLQEKNLVVPVSGDFAGPKAIRAIAAYLQKHGGIVSAFYVSNVEQYLFPDNKHRAFYDNVATLPVDGSSVFIRPYSLRRSGMAQSLCGIVGFLNAVGEGRIQTNNDALACVR
jgi:hypothetical protein